MQTWIRHVVHELLIYDCMLILPEKIRAPGFFRRLALVNMGYLLKNCLHTGSYGVSVSLLSRFYAPVSSVIACRLDAGISCASWAGNTEKRTAVRSESPIST